MANLTLQFKGSITARERKCDKFGGTLMRISCQHVAENPKEERLKFPRVCCCLNYKKFGGRKSRTDMVAPWSSETVPSTFLCHCS